MTLRIVGAGLGRTGTLSLKSALERLLGGTCYHMREVFGRPGDIGVWHEAALGRSPDWRAFFDDFTAVVDWPAAPFWREIADAFPEAPVLLSVRDPDDWWRSADRTILEIFRLPVKPGDEGWRAMVDDLFSRTFTPDFLDPDAAKAAMLRHNDEVRSAVDPARLVEWRPGDGWAPICAALGLPVPDEPFPRTNTTAEFRTNLGLEV